MLVLATFTSICIAAILFLIRFLFALNSDAEAASGRVERISAGLALIRRNGVCESAPVLTLIHANSSRQVVYSYTRFAAIRK